MPLRAGVALAAHGELFDDDPARADIRDQIVPHSEALSDGPAAVAAYLETGESDMTPEELFGDDFDPATADLDTVERGAFAVLLKLLIEQDED
ncbi:MAG: hypothetical protein ACOCYZ_03785 [Halococcoides sp.]